MRERNAEVPENARITFRVGINVGDVIVEGDDIHGDGVNVAARLEGICPPGEVCVSGTVYDQAAGKLQAAFEDLGEQSVKNIARPVRVYRVRLEAGEGAASEAASAALPLPDKPSIAVLPFANMSGDPEQEYFADGLSEDIITALSRFQWFFVIARNSSFSYKGTSPDVRDVARDLGVHYVLEGGVRKARDRVRATAQLIDGSTGHHVWAERSDRDLDDIFVVQDEITEAIAGSVAPSFVSAEARRVRSKHPKSLDSWDRAVRGYQHLWRLGRDNLAEARRLFGEALGIDSNSTFALVGLALACSWQCFWGWADDPDQTRAKAYEAAQRAVSLDGDDAWAHAALALVYRHRRENDSAIGAARRALNLNPSLAFAESALALALAWTKGEYDQAVLHSDRALRLSPRDPAKVWSMIPRIVAAFVNERHEDQVEWAKRITEITPDHPSAWRFLAAGYAELDRLEEARSAIQQYLRLLPHHTVRTIRGTVAATTPELIERLMSALRKAGLPE